MEKYEDAKNKATEQIELERSRNNSCRSFAQLLSVGWIGRDDGIWNYELADGEEGILVILLGFEFNNPTNHLNVK